MAMQVNDTDSLERTVGELLRDKRIAPTSRVKTHIAALGDTTMLDLARCYG